MNEIQLSDDLNVITAEINSYKQVAGQSIFEIGKRLKHVRENIEHGNWQGWLDSVGIDRTTAGQMMKIASDKTLNNSTYMDLGARALYEISTLSVEEREKEHTLSSGETKTTDEMTVRELQEVKRKNKELEQAKQHAESQTEKARESERIALKQLEEEQSKEPKTIEKEVIKEVAPDDLKNKLASTQRQLDFVNSQLNKHEKEKEQNKLNEVEFDEEQAEKERKKLEWEADKNVLEMKIEVDKFMERVAITAFQKGAIATSGKSTKEKLHQSVDELKEFISQMEIVLSGRIEI